MRDGHRTQLVFSGSLEAQDTEAAWGKAGLLFSPEEL